MVFFEDQPMKVKAALFHHTLNEIFKLLIDASKAFVSGPPLLIVMLQKTKGINRG
jgi:hypothetical protein